MVTERCTIREQLGWPDAYQTHGPSKWPWADEVLLLTSPSITEHGVILLITLQDLSM